MCNDNEVYFKKKYLVYLSLFISVTWLSYYMRLCVLPVKIAKINFLAIISIIIIVFHYFKRYNWKDKFTNFINVTVLLCVTVMSFFYFRTQMMHGKTVMNTLLYFFNLIFPCLLVMVRLQSSDKKRVIRIGVNILDSLIVLMIMMVIVDTITGNKLMIVFARMTHDSALITFSGTRSMRKASVMGHYLPTAEVYILQFVIHFLVKNIYPKRYIFSMIAAILGVSLAASKGGIVLILALILLFNIKDIRIMLVSLGILGIANWFGLFSTVINRFTNGSSLTSGREEVWENLSMIYDDLIPLVYGHGSESTHMLNKKHNWASAAFEYPFRAFPYEYGLIFTICIYIILIGIPLLILLRHRQIFKCFGLGATFVYANTFNGWVLGTDYLYLYVVVVFLILNMNYNEDFEYLYRLIPKKSRRKFRKWLESNVIM